jgi:phosphatidylglycerophosphate synthase
MVGTVPNALTLAGYTLGVWWCLGGPTWAGVASIAIDEVDGRLARATGTESELGARLDRAVDTCLVPLSLLRLGKATGTGVAPALVGSGSALLLQSRSAENEYRPPVGSLRAGIMVGTMLIEAMGRRR